MQIVRNFMDPLSEVLTLLRLQGAISGGFPVEAQTALVFAPHQGIKCYCVVEGCCWVAVDGNQQPLLLETGDCVFLTSGKSFSLATHPTAKRQPFVPPDSETGALTQVTPDQGAFILGGRYTFDSALADILLQALPAIIPVREGTGTNIMRSAMECLREEIQTSQPGGVLLSQQLVQIMLVQALRVFLQQEGEERIGWLFALCDPQLKAALNLMHADPAFPWTLQELAHRTGMSRTVFAKKFKSRVGMTPMRYLSRWRMLLAGERLRSSREPISQISFSAGYDTESAFGRAFKKEWGCSPREHRQQQQNATL